MGMDRPLQKGLFEPIMTVSSFVTHLKRVPAGVGVDMGIFCNDASYYACDDWAWLC